MSIISDGTRRTPPPGSGLLQRVDLPFGRFERIAAQPGDFSAAFDQHAVVVSACCPPGQVVHNARRAGLRRISGPVYSILKPGDQVEGRLDAQTTYEILILCPRFAEEVLQRELGTEATRLASVIRAPLPTLAQAIWRRLGEVLAAAPPDAATRAALCVELLIIKLVETQLQVVEAPGIGEKIDVIEKATEFVDANLGDRLDVRAIAEGVGLSPAYFSRLFHSALGVSVHRFVLDRRLARARTLLLDSDLPISEIAFATGFSSQSHLTTVYRHRFGATPSQFREAHAGAGGVRNTGRRRT